MKLRNIIEKLIIKQRFIKEKLIIKQRFIKEKSIIKQRFIKEKLLRDLIKEARSLVSIEAGGNPMKFTKMHGI